MTSNGSQIAAGRLNAPSNASKSDIRPQPSLPAFASTSHARTTDRPAGARGRLKSWDHLSTDEVIRRGAKAAAEADASRGVGLLGNLTLVGFVLLAIGMAGIAVHQEQRLAPRERQLLEQRR